MYDYVQTPKGWVLCWGGAFLYRETLERLQAVSVVEDRPATQTDRTAVEPMTAQSA